MTTPLIIKVTNGQWYAVKDGKHLTAQETAALIAKGTSYRFEPAETASLVGRSAERH